MLSEAVDDPELTEVLDACDGTVPSRKQRQFLFANTRDANHPVFRAYWYAARTHRALLVARSEELGRG
ncbi:MULTISPECIES: DUF6082 family protein [unclassified Streptomyces]|uniref:DUF6082 family protein n=1 Tax=unclassified Streptomyces TaxID=2593676 RepID=UPI0033ACF73F